MTEITNEAWKAGVRRELVDHILPFWKRRAFDPNGGFYGFVGNDLKTDTQAQRSIVLNARILWTFSTASRVLGSEYRPLADHAFAYIRTKFYDEKFGGLFWMLDAEGKVVSDRKQIYAQAFGIYGLTEYFRVTKDPESLEMAKALYRLIEAHSRDDAAGGYLEARARDWSPLEDLRLSEKDLNCPKSMNTHLHIMEAYTNLLRVWRDPELVKRQTALLALTLDRIYDDATGHLKLFFDADWHSLTDGVSFGHDIETSWLLMEAAEVLGDAALTARAKAAAMKLARTVYKEGRDTDGSIFYEADGQGKLTDANKHWWAQAESVIGFYNAYQLSGEAAFARQSQAAWQFIVARVVDPKSGEWFAKLTPQNVPLTPEQDGDACLAGPWKCPYHNSRACFEMLARIS